MRQLTYFGTRDLQWRDVAEPRLDSDWAALVEPVAVSTCDMDALVIHGGVKIKSPTAVGHEGVGRVIDVGPSVSMVAVGDLVLIPWKVSCGTCRFCRRGQSGQCESVVPEASFSWGPTPENGGFLSDLVRVPFADAMLRRVPDGADPALVAGVADNITDGWRAVGPGLRDRPGGSVLVVGGGAPGSIGLYAAGIACALGASRVVFASASEDHRRRAEQMGATSVDLGVTKVSDLDRFDITVDALGDRELFPAIVDRTDRAGLFTSTAAVVYAFGEIAVDWYKLYRRSVTISTGWVHTVDMLDAPLQLIADGTFDPSPVTSHLVSFDDVADVLVESFVKVIATR
jgi:threonine dehydrogenase-like Zn-dependent dehydrogenase